MALEVANQVAIQEAEVIQLFQTLSCNRCGIKKPIHEFSERKDRKRGFEYHCRECGRIEGRLQSEKWRNKHKPDRLVGEKLYAYIGERTNQRFAKARQKLIDKINETGLLTCTKCKQDKPLVSFTQDKRRPSGHRASCKDCSGEYYSKHQNGYYHRNKDKISKKAKWYRHKYELGFSKEDYYKMLSEQNGSCAICLKKSDGYLCIDHNHKTYKVRGLLCNRCNSGIGHLNDSVMVVKNAAKYLEDRGCYGS